jgi:hypothetical protein
MSVIDVLSYLCVVYIYKAVTNFFSNFCPEVEKIYEWGGPIKNKKGALFLQKIYCNFYY